jgi:hypothetical protein
MSLWRATLALALFASLPMHAADVQKVLAPARERLRTSDFRVTGRLVKVDGNGKRTSEDITLKAKWFSGSLKVLLDVRSPAAARAHILLEMRPDGHDSILIAHPGDAIAKALPPEQWSDGPNGPGFSYEDFLDAQYFWAGQQLAGQPRYGAHDCNLVRSTPGAAERSGYSEVRSWLDREIAFPVYVEKVLRRSGAVKEYIYYGLRHNGGIWSASQVEVKFHGRAGSTLLIIERGTGKANLTAEEFNAESLTHF